VTMQVARLLLKSIQSPTRPNPIHHQYGASAPLLFEAAELKLQIRCTS